MIIGNYTEGNAASDYILSDIPGGGASYGVLIAGNAMLSTAPGFNVKVGRTVGASIANYCTGDMFDLTNTRMGEFASFGDYCTGTKYSKDGFWDVAAAGVLPLTTGITAYAGGGQANATKLKKPLNRVTTVATGGDSVALLPTDMVTTAHGMTMIVENAGASSLSVYYHPDDVANYGAGGGRTTAFVVPAGASALFVSSTPGNWRRFSGTTTASTIADPAGGALIDAEARAAIASIIDALQAIQIVA